MYDAASSTVAHCPTPLLRKPALLYCFCYLNQRQIWVSFLHFKEYLWLANSWMYASPVAKSNFLASCAEGIQSQLNLIIFHVGPMTFPIKTLYKIISWLKFLPYSGHHKQNYDWRQWRHWRSHTTFCWHQQHAGLPQDCIETESPECRLQSESWRSLYLLQHVPYPTYIPCGKFQELQIISLYCLN